MTATDLPGGSPATDAGRPFVPPTHPVRRAALLLVAVALALGAIWWSGAAAPRVSVPGWAGDYDLSTRTGLAQVELRNDAPLWFEITEATLVAEGVRTVGSEVDGKPLAGGARVAAGGRTTLTIRYAVEGCPTAGDLSSWRIRVSTRTALGLERTTTQAARPLLADAIWRVPGALCAGQTP